MGMNQTKVSEGNMGNGSDTTRYRDDNYEKRSFTREELKVMSFEDLVEQKHYFSGQVNDINQQLANHRDAGCPANREKWRQSAAQAKRAVDRQLRIVKEELRKRHRESVVPDEPAVGTRTLLSAILATDIGLDAMDYNAEQLDSRVWECLIAAERIMKSVERVRGEGNGKNH